MLRENDSFDRMLEAQAQRESLALAATDFERTITTGRSIDAAELSRTYTVSCRRFDGNYSLPFAPRPSLPDP